MLFEFLKNRVNEKYPGTSSWFNERIIYIYIYIYRERERERGFLYRVLCIRNV